MTMESTSLHRWKQGVKRTIWEQYKTDWSITTHTMSTLDILRHKEGPSWEGYLDGSWGGKCLFKLRAGDWNMWTRRRHWRTQQEPECKLCHKEVETATHVIGECQCISSQRNKLIETLGLVQLARTWLQSPQQGAALLLGVGGSEVGKQWGARQNFCKAIYKAWRSTN